MTTIKTRIKSKYTTMNTENWENDQPKVAKESLEKYKGFYVARFEAGVPSGASFYTNSAGVYTQEGRGSETETDSIKTLKPVSKKGVQAWNLITQPNAKMVAENMYSDKYSASSYLMDNTAWNVICNKFEGILGNEVEGRTIKKSTQLGNYYTNVTTDYKSLKGIWALHERNDLEMAYAENYRTVGITDEDLENVRKKGYALELGTGLSDDFKIYNIYDMAGNMWEWTTGHNNSEGSQYVIVRGGCCGARKW